MDVQEIEQKNHKMALVLKIIEFQLQTTNSRNPEEDTCHWRLIYYETPLRFKISLREIFSKSGSLRALKKYD